MNNEKVFPEEYHQETLFKDPLPRKNNFDRP